MTDLSKHGLEPVAWLYRRTNGQAVTTTPTTERLPDWMRGKDSTETALYRADQVAEVVERLEARVAGLTQERDFHRQTADLHADRIEALEARIPKHPHPLDLSTRFPLGTRVRKISGPQWRGVVVGYYSSSYTPEGLVIECTAEGARGQVHVEPAKRIERDD